MTPAAAAERWRLTWKRAWEALDTDAIVALYSADALLSTEPFRTPHRGSEGVRTYVSRVFGEEENPEVWVAPAIVDGDRAAIPWWASFEEDGVATTIAGVSMLRFDPAGQVVEQWDAFNVGQGRVQPPTDWSPFGSPAT